MTRLSWIAVSGWLVLLGCWIGSLAGLYILPLLGQAVLLAALAATFLAGVQALRRPPPSDAARPRWPLRALLVLAVVVRLVGQTYGLAERYNQDEGTYAKRVSEINDGQPLPITFLYPHLVFYLQAFAVWLTSLAPGAYLAATKLLWGVDSLTLGFRLTLRLVVALTSVLLVVPVYRIGERIGGTPAAVLGALLCVFSPLLNEWSHVSTCDVPAALFATLTVHFAARLNDQECRRDYLLGGAAAGLAAAAKYPAGLACLALVAAFVRGRLRSRDFSLDIVRAGLASIAAFLIADPAIFVHAREALFGKFSILTGPSLYSGGGWVGVLADSNTLYYGRLLVDNFGWLALVLGAAGSAWLGRQGLVRVLWLLPFPVVFLAVLLAMRIVVPRNLFPILPLLCALLGSGVWAVATAGAERLGRRVQGLAAVVAAVCLVHPALETVRQEVQFLRPDNREIARIWLNENLPPGATVAREEFTPTLSGRDFGVWSLPRFAVRVPREELLQPEVDFLLLSSASWGRFFDGHSSGEIVDRGRQGYEYLFSRLPLRRRFDPGRWHAGPEVRVYVVEPEQPAYQRSARIPAETLFVPSPRMRKGEAGYAHFVDAGEWCMAKGFFAAGSYRIRLEGNVTYPGEGAVRDSRNQTVASFKLDGTPEATVDLPRAERYFIYFWMPVGTSVAAVTLTPAGG